MIDDVAIPLVMGLFFTGYLPHMLWMWIEHRRAVRHRTIVMRWWREIEQQASADHAGDDAMEVST